MSERMICSAYSRASGNSARADNLVIASLAKQSSFIARPCWIASSLTGSAVASVAIEKAKQEAWYAGMRELSDQELQAIADKANAEATFGFDAKQDKKGNWIQQGIGSENNPSTNHLAALKKRESLGQERPGTYEKALADTWRRHPDWCAKANLPKPEEAI